MLKELDLLDDEGGEAMKAPLIALHNDAIRTLAPVITEEGGTVKKTKKRKRKRGVSDRL